MDTEFRKSHITCATSKITNQNGLDRGKVSLHEGGPWRGDEDFLDIAFDSFPCSRDVLHVRVEGGEAKGGGVVAKSSMDSPILPNLHPAANDHRGSTSSRHTENRLDYPRNHGCARNHTSVGKTNYAYSSDGLPM